MSLLHWGLCVWSQYLVTAGGALPAQGRRATIVMVNISTVKSFCRLHLEESQRSRLWTYQWCNCFAEILGKTTKKHSKTNQINHAYINSSKQVKRVCIGESGLLSSFSIFCHECHGFHWKKWRNFLHARKKKKKRWFIKKTIHLHVHNFHRASMDLLAHQLHASLALIYIQSTGTIRETVPKITVGKHI